MKAIAAAFGVGKMWLFFKNRYVDHSGFAHCVDRIGCRLIAMLSEKVELELMKYNEGEAPSS